MNKLKTIIYMISNIGAVWKESVNEFKNSEEYDEIERYWNKKALFVHRRALVLGAIRGFFIGLWTYRTLLFVIDIWK